MKLYYTPGACSLAPHIVLREAERRFDLERVDLASHRTASGADYRSINPKGYVPALQLDQPPELRSSEDQDGRARAEPELITEVSAIVQYIAELVPSRQLAPPPGTLERTRLHEWLGFISTELHKQFSPMFVPGTPPSYASRLRGRIGERLLHVQDVLVGRGFLLGETFTVADAYLFVVLQWCDRFGIDLALFPNLDDYELRIFRRPAVQAAMIAEGLHGRHHYRAA